MAARQCLIWRVSGRASGMSQHEIDTSPPGVRIEYDASPRKAGCDLVHPAHDSSILEVPNRNEFVNPFRLTRR